jgi:DNA-binding NarL/FixJ family response regulator
MTHPPSAAGTRNHFDSDLARRDAAAARQRPARPAGGAGRAGPGHPRASSAVPIGRAHERPPRVVIADHHPASRVGLRLTLEGAGFHVVAEAGTGEQAAALAAALRPDACLLAIDIRGGGTVAARAISTRAPGTAVVMLTGRVDGDDLVDAVIAGASGVVLRTIAPERLPVVIRRAIAGEAVIPRALGRRVLEELRRRGNCAAGPDARERADGLTPREGEVTQLVQRGMSTREIAARLGIAEVTVRRHVSAALRKLEVPDREAAVRLSQRSETTSGRTSGR